MKNICEQISIKQFKIDRIIPLEKFRRFLIYACYYNEINKHKDTLDFLLKNRKFFQWEKRMEKLKLLQMKYFHINLEVEL